ncbi:4-hydroxy-tetrahydrodipicolinate synthase [Paenibacillus radicis (ex Xue et al. 2023)]|uniref:4-hydroxy-tetrahydrodipicolinate synthase n=1 Tax=Paenibacillus radicis (ex Xue et al. 2023) TaxID=2972489 RepID=A0ABT1YBR6_9BACL|nr:4-hydroxy-tetrahydrodipicolinate synthase [Paenibacillus radicis (ex Xue et al. 2023)]MCR8630633.1 4-hydroxy-tetrahydrodipicolinate synthase [Paenibacillus radicis (ex Xue et al. 2023)]
MFKAEGIIPAMITPFNEQQEINEEALRMLVKRFIKAGVHGLFCLGTNGEFFSLSYEEKKRIATIIVEETRGQIPVYVGAGCISTAETIRLAREMESIGVDALSVITPYFLAFSQKELADYYRALANETSLPILLYNIPGRTGNALHPKTVGELARIPNIVGIKDSSGSFDTILNYLMESDEGFSVLAGTDSLILSTLMSGGKGAIAATANLFPELVVAIYDLWKQGKIEEAEAMQRGLREIRSAFQWGTLPSVLKEAMNWAGLPAGPCRLPVSPLTAEKQVELTHLMDSYQKQGLLISNAATIPLKKVT